MYIKEIELKNFKSFGKKVVIPFYDDFTAISGPNGSGKSNIIDAILFCLALSTSRKLRAERLPDLIYNGQNGSNPDNAYVTIRFDNSERELPIDEDTVSVKRRIRRTENSYYSYYYINGKSSSQGEVHDLLAQAKVTPEGYNVILQGDVTEITKMTPRERRHIIDEIAGVAEFDDKKEKALSELEVVRERIERTDLVLNEVEIRIEQLKEEREQALKYQNLREDKHRHEGFFVLAKLNTALEELETTKEEIESKEFRREQGQEEIQEIRESSQEIKDRLSELNERITHMGEDEQIQLKREIEQIRGEIARAEGSIELAREELSDIDEKRRKALIEIDETRAQIEELEEELEEQELRKASVLGEIEEKQGELDMLRIQIAEVDSEYADTRDRLEEVKGLLEEERGEKNKLLREMDRHLDDLRRKTAEEQELEGEIEEARAEIQDLSEDSIQSQIQELEAEIQRLQEDIDDLESSRSQVKKELDEVNEELHKLQQEYARADATVKAAKEMSGLRPAVKTVMKAKESRRLQGIYGTIAELGRVNKKYSTALEIAAGGRLQCVVVDHDSDAADAIEFLKRQGSGRATFLPLNKMQSRDPHRDVSDMDGVIDYAINLVEFDPKFKPAFSYVFGDTIVVEDLDTARRLMGGLRMVTLDGELISKSGAMTGGSRSRRSRFGFAAAEEEKLEKLAEKITELESRRQTLLNKIDSLDGHISSTKREISEHENEVERHQIKIEELESRRERLHEAVEQKKQALEELEGERNRVASRVDELEAGIEAHDKRISEYEEEVRELEKELKGSDIPRLSEEAKQIESEISGLRERVKDIEAEIKSTELEKSYAEKQVEETREEIEQFDERKQEMRERIREQEERIQELEARIEEKEEREQELADELADLKEERSQVQEELDEWEEKRDTVQRELDKLEGQILSAEATKEELERQIQELREEVVERGLDVDAEVPPLEKVRTKIEAIERAMTRMEPVNMRAIEEYDQVKDRQGELRERRDTLFNEREQILERIGKYEEMKKDTFMRTFNAINENFQEVFHDLSGGDGSLVLEDEEDPFEGGLTIRARSKGKNVQSLEAMSGGEKSLTALAFIFGIQQHLPAPFYAFDEIDMFLDGVNVELVARMIERGAEKAQFIVASLRKPMIEAASCTIGVVMQENNVSTITGVKLN